MRLHRLEIQAFGPFARRQVVDFDELGSHGLFLLNGPTGAGKTSVLDAVCFALYGQVPGARHEGKRLRSDHAEAGLAPEVVCEFSAGGRRFEVTRSPQWQRPSKRANGTGLTTEQARTLLRERIDGQWVQKSARNDEAGAEITGVLGMDREQFTKVVMLPQGDFAAFLRSPASERLELLQQLFGTERFELVEKRLAADAAEAKAVCAAAEVRLAQLRSRALEEVLRYTEGDESAQVRVLVEGGATTGSGDEPSAGGAMVRLRTVLSGKTEAAERDLADASGQHAGLQARLGELEGQRARALELEGLRRAEADVAARRSEHDDAVRRLSAHRSAQLLVPVMTASGQAAERETAAAAAASRSMAGLLRHDLAVEYLGARELPVQQLSAQELTAQDLAGRSAESPGRKSVEGAGPENADLDTRLEQLAAATARAGAEAGKIEAALPQEQRLLQKGAELETVRGTIGRLEAEQDRLADAVRRAGGDIEAAAAEHTRTAAASAALDQTRERAETAAALVQTIEAYVGCRERVRERERARDAARAGHLELKERWLQLMKQRLEQAAAELAGTLEAGRDCPVCGSIEHPRPARAAAGSLVRPEDEDAAQEAQQRAEKALEKASAALAESERDLAALAAQGGDGDLDLAREAAGRAADAFAEASEAARHLEEASARLAALEQLRIEQEEASRNNALELARLRTAATVLEEEVRQGTAELDLLRAGHPTLADRAAGLGRFLQLLADCADNLHRHRSARSESARAAASLDEAVAGSEFDSLEQAREALLDDSVAAQLEAVRDRFAQDEQRVRLLRESPQIAQALADEAAATVVPSETELEDSRKRLVELAAQIRHAEVRLGLLQASAAQLEACAAELERETDAAAPLWERFELLQGLAESARGNGENSYRMTLNTYVLAARLEQVAIAASERLSTMTDGRYTLVYSDSLASRGRKSGLGLHVTDEWTGQQRDTATLSGGESFMASLALALGLADVVQQESGGVDIETLFVDEGFGSLDDQALEQVMDALEGLRDGGRVVGLVSHVAEMKLRVGAQLQVVKGRNGSTLHFAVLGAPAA